LCHQSLADSTAIVIEAISFPSRQIRRDAPSSQSDLNLRVQTADFRRANTANHRHDLVYRETTTSQTQPAIHPMPRFAKSAFQLVESIGRENPLNRHFFANRPSGRFALSVCEKIALPGGALQSRQTVALLSDNPKTRGPLSFANRHHGGTSVLSCSFPSRCRTRSCARWATTRSNGSCSP
jgi:hypothetical protein